MSRRSSIVPRDLHAWLPWLLAATFVLAAEALGQHFALTPPERTLLRAPVASSVVLLLAIRRYWNHDRAAFECVSLGALAPAAWLLSRSLAGAVQPLPLLVLVGTLPGYAAWRFAPDCGQRGTLWALRDAFRRPLIVLIPGVLALLLLVGCTPKITSKPEPRGIPVRSGVPARQSTPT